MKSYSQFSEGVEEVRLKEWEKLDEGTKKEIVKQFAEENNIELDEENLEVFEEAVATAMATSPLWLPPLLKAGAWTAGILGTGWAANKHLKNREERKNAETFLQSKELPKSSRTNQQRDQTANANKENQNLENKNNKEEIKNQRESEKINKQLQNTLLDANTTSKKLESIKNKFVESIPVNTTGDSNAKIEQVTKLYTDLIKVKRQSESLLELRNTVAKEIERIAESADIATKTRNEIVLANV